MRLEEVQHALWNIVDYDVLFGRCEERTKIITGASSDGVDHVPGRFVNDVPGCSGHAG